ncbi:putative otitis media-associated P41 [Streptococcus pneumoniae]|nr:putative otitis media-associated P41 [Streptococcus pneumoniae]
MNITYIVGNGLDLQYGLKTRYRDYIMGQQNHSGINYELIFIIFILSHQFMHMGRWMSARF